MSSFEPHPPPRFELNELLARCIIGGVETLFHTTFNIKIKAEKFSVSHSYQNIADIFGKMDMSQSSLEGKMIVAFPAPVILKIIGTIYKKDFQEIDKSIQGGVGEMTNIIYAQVKKSLNEHGYRFVMSVPQVVVVNKQESSQQQHSENSLVVPFTTEYGQFVVFVTAPTAA